MISTRKYMSHEDVLIESLKANGTFNEADSNTHSVKTGTSYAVKGKSTPDDMVDLLNKRSRSIHKMRRFKDAVQHKFTESAIDSVFDILMEANLAEPREYAIGYGIISKFVNEEGYRNLLKRFSTKNLVLSEMAQLIDDYSSAVIAMEGANKDTTDAKINIDDDLCYSMDKSVADDFVSHIKDLVPKNTIKIIQTRVANAIEDFMNQNTDNKLDIKNIYAKANQRIKDKEASAIDADNEEKMNEIKEEYIIRAKQEATKVYDRPTNVFGAMCRIMSESIHSNKTLNQQYVNEDGKFDVKRIVNEAAIVYNVLEMMNTMEMVDVDKNYIKEMLTDLKG